MNNPKRRPRRRIICDPPRDCFECPYSDCMRGGSDRALPTKEERKFTEAGKAPRAHFVDAGEKSPEEREKILQDILSTIKEK